MWIRRYRKRFIDLFCSNVFQSIKNVCGNSGKSYFCSGIQSARNMKLEEKVRENIKKYVENTSGITLGARSSYDELSLKIAKHLGERISATTLRRFFGYQQDGAEGAGCSSSTVNTIARYLGFKNIEEITSLEEFENSPSDFIDEIPSINPADLEYGDQIRVTWTPNRSMIIQYEGADEIFKVVECQNGKLHAGDTFHCRHIVQNEPMICKYVIRTDTPPMNYVCGRVSGIHFELLEK